MFKLNNSVLIFVTHTITNMEVDISSGKIKVFNGKKKLKITVKFPIMNNEIKDKKVLLEYLIHRVRHYSYQIFLQLSFLKNISKRM